VHTQLSSFIHSVSCYLQCNFCDLRHFVTQVKMMSFSVCFTCLIFFLSLCRNCYQYCCHCSRITNPVHAVDFGAAVFSRVIIQNFNWLQVFVPLKSFCCFPTFVSMAVSNYSFSKLIPYFILYFVLRSILWYTYYWMQSNSEFLRWYRKFYILLI